MKSSAEKSSSTTSTNATHTASQPFFAKAGGGSFFAPAATPAPAVQFKMAVNKPGDKFEQEADKMAGKVMRMPTPVSPEKEDKIQKAAIPEEKVQKKEEDKIQKAALPEEKLQKKEEDKIQKAAMPEEKIQKKEDEKLQKAPATEEKLQRKGAGAPAVGASTQAAITSKTSDGQPLSSDVRSYMEPRFNADFSNVRVHSDPESASLSNQLSARAFTYQNHVFFSRDQYQPGTSEGKQLLAHELTHTIQQGHAVQRSPQVSTTTTPPPIQREWSLPDIDIPNPLEYLAKKATEFINKHAEDLPGFTMLTVVMGKNPLTGATVDRSPGNILRGAIKMIPGGGFVTQALDNHGVFEKVSAWTSQQFNVLKEIGSNIKTDVKNFVNKFSITDLKNPGAIWTQAQNIITTPITQIKNFAIGLVDGIAALIKDAILKPIAKFAKANLPNAYDLLSVILGKDPISGEGVTPSAENLIAPVMKMIGQEDVWTRMQEANAIPRAFAWFQSTVGEAKTLLSSIPDKFIAAFTALTIEDIVLIAKAFSKIAGVFGSVAGTVIKWGADKVWKLLEIVFDVVSPGAFGYVKKTGAALKSILKNPLPFVGNLVNAAKLGFQNFAGNFLGHLKAGLIDWLTGSLTGVYIPKALSLPEMGKFAMSVLGITWAQIRGKIVKALGPTGETIMKGLETGFDIVVALIKGGPAAAWELIKEKLTDLKDMVVGGIIDFVTDTVVKKAIPKLIAMFIPGAGFISAIISIYDTVMVFVQKISKIIQVVTGFINSIVAIASGNIAAAASRVESILANLLSLAISFLAGFAGLGKVSDKIMGVIGKVRGKIDKALDTIINSIIGKAKAWFAKIFGGKDKKDQRNDADKKRDKLAAIGEAEKLLPEKGFDEQAVRGKLGSIKSRYKLLTLNLVIDAKKDQTETVHFTASASQEEVGQTKTVQVATMLNEVVLSKPFEAREKKATEKKLAMTRKELRDQVKIQENALSNLMVGVWKKNWEKFYGPEGGRSEESQANRDRDIAINVERSNVIALWMGNNPGKTIAEANAFADELFTRRPGDKAYPFMYKSRISNGITYVNPVYGKTILHAADQAAGGGTETAGLGGARENFSIGAQWGRGGRAQILKGQLDSEIANAAKTNEPSAVEKLKLKVNLPVVDV